METSSIKQIAIPIAIAIAAYLYTHRGTAVEAKSMFPGTPAGISMSLSNHKSIGIILTGLKKRIDDGKIKTSTQMNTWIKAAAHKARLKAYTPLHQALEDVNSKNDGKWNSSDMSEVAGNKAKDFGAKP